MDTMYLSGLLFITVIAFAVAVVVEVDEGNDATLQCPLSGNFQYPSWTGPEGLENPLNQRQNIKEAGFTWENNKKDLKVIGAMLKHDGNYTCDDGNGNTGMVELDVQYFSASTDITEATPEDYEVTFTCKVWSNPRSQIKPHTFARNIPGDNRTSSTTFHPCELDPLTNNKMMCSMTDITYVMKQDNGRELKCEFEYKNSTHLTLKKSIVYLFPPTQVEISGNKPITDSATKTLNLTCSTDSSNPVSTLIWRKGKKSEASENTEIDSTYTAVSMDADYNGKNITQKLDLPVKDAKDDEKVFCCAVHRTKEYCDSVTLDVTAAGSVLTVLNSLVLVCVIFVASLYG